MLEITILDNDVARIKAIEKNLQAALQELGTKAAIKIVSEPPFLSRENLLSRLPVLEIMDQYWSLAPQKAFTKAQCLSLLSRIFFKGNYRVVN